MAIVNQITDGLADKVVGNGETFQVVILEELPFVLNIIVTAQCLIDVKVVAPAGKLESIEAHFLGFGSKFVNREVGPLAGEECYGSGHDLFIIMGCRCVRS